MYVRKLVTFFSKTNNSFHNSIRLTINVTNDESIILLKIGNGGQVQMIFFCFFFIKFSKSFFLYKQFVNLNEDDYILRRRYTETTVVCVCMCIWKGGLQW